MDQRLSMLMVGAKDVSALRAFYEEGLGWTSWVPATPMTAMYKLGTTVIVFLDAAYLAKESGMPTVETPKSMFAIFVSTKEEVHSIFTQVAAAGATVTSAIRDRDFEVYSGYFADPEGNGWEVAWSPHMPVGVDGGLTLGA